MSLIIRHTNMAGISAFLLVLMSWFALSPSVVGQRRGPRAQPQSQSQTSQSKAILAQAELYYKNDDITKDRAAALYRQVRDQFSNSKDAETAQYFLASYYHRKFYIQREKQLTENQAPLNEAATQYEEYVNKYAWRSKSPDWLSDAYFNLALISLERGDTYKAEQWLGKMYGASPYDQKVYVHQVIWSPNARDVIDSSYDAKALSEYTNSLVYAQRQRKLSSFNSIVDKLKAWCNSQKRSGA
ncbi:MAG TPA: hypothetical protein VGJ55_03280 [Pyrinomonadaceae bacterium]|jgi:tetratricopeptide (TPR) repeat protein